jgi:hypothetical protein
MVRHEPLTYPVTNAELTMSRSGTERVIGEDAAPI